MIKIFINQILILLAMLFSQQLSAQNLYDLNTIQKIEITFTQADWDHQMDTAKNGSEEYLMASEVKINGIIYDSVGVKYKGNSSYDSTYLKNPLHIEFDAFKDQKHQGYTDIKLSNSYGDPSMIREVLAYNILKNYMHCPLSNFAQVYINGAYIGLYSSAENIDKNFCADHFYSSQNTFVKCNPTGTFGPSSKSSLRYLTSDSTDYYPYYEMKSDTGWKDFVTLCDSVTNNPSSLDNKLDVDRLIWMLAFNNLVINLDSYNGVFSQNHYTYKDNTGHFNPIVWDLNMAFGAFPFAGIGASSMGTLSILQMQQLSLANHGTDTNWTLIKAIQSDASYKKKYVAHMRTIINEFFVSNAYQTMATQLRTLVDTATFSDNNKFFTYAQFQNAMDSMVDVGSYDVPGISALMSARATYLLSTAELSATTPTISSINSSVPNPVYNASFNMNATVLNALSSSVVLGYRFDKTQKFKKVSLYDDGAHNDGAAGDNVFGASLTMQGGQMQYYIYAENNDAAIFSPERAEHEFHTLFATSQAPTLGQLVINEILCDNVNKQRDEYGNTEDWIELYNTSNQLLNLSDIYLSDNISTPNKWKFPANTTIHPNGYLTIWADDDSAQQILHTNFQFNKDSGEVVLSNATLQILDSVSYGAQTTNISYGRFPNGTGGFIAMSTTFGYINNNYPASIENVDYKNQFVLYPNPAKDQITLLFDGTQNITIFTLQGQQIYSGNDIKNHSIDISNWGRGLYLVKCGNKTQKLVIE